MTGKDRIESATAMASLWLIQAALHHTVSGMSEADFAVNRIPNLIVFYLPHVITGIAALWMLLLTTFLIVGFFVRRAAHFDDGDET